MPPGNSPEEQAQLVRANAQCLLVNNYGLIEMNSGVSKRGVESGMSKARDMLINAQPSSVKPFPLDTPQTCITYHNGGPDDIVNALTMDTPTAQPPTAFLNATPAQLSLLQPRLEFYLRTNITDPNNPEHYLPKDRRIVFSDHVLADRQKALAGFRAGDQDAILRGANGYNVGIKEFNWNYDNKHEGDRIIKAQLTLYFGSMAELTNQYYLDFLFADGKRNVHQQTAAQPKTTQEKIQQLERSLTSRADLVKNGVYEARTQSNVLRDSQQLKVIVGWSMPDRVVSSLFDSGEQQRQFYEAVQNSQRTLLLNITQYDINFNQNGSCEVVIEYIASTDAYIGSPSADIFSNRNLPSGNGRNERDKAFVTARDGFFDYAGISNEVWPEGYLYNEYQKQEQDLPAIDGIKKMEVYVDAVIAEVEWIEEKMQLLELKGANNPGAANSQAAEEYKEFKEWYDRATQALEEAYISARVTKHEAFMSRLLEPMNSPNAAFPTRVFFVDADLQDIENTRAGGGPPAKYLRLRAGGPRGADTVATTAYGAFRARFNNLTRVQSLAPAASTTEREYLDAPGGVLDPTGTIIHNPDTRIGTTRRLYYIRLGDLIQVAADAAGLSIENQILLGTFLPRLSKFRYGANKGQPPQGRALSDDPSSLANLPISLEYFGNWFYEYVISKDREQYFFRRFLDDLLNGLVQPILTTLCGDTKDLRIGYTLHTVASDFLPKIVALSKQSTPPPGIPRSVSPSSIQMGGEPFLKEVRAAASRAIYAGVDQPLTTIILIHAEQVNTVRTGDITQDEKEGVYHFFLGADRGLVKQFNFSKKQMPQLRAMNIERVNKGASKAGILVLPMDVSLTMFGNGLLRNGSMIFVNADFGLGTRVADQLALGGYYRVYKSSHTIRPGYYETTVDCIFERPRNFPSD